MASIGQEKLLNFELNFTARFSSALNKDSYIGVGLRSQSIDPHFAHLLYLTLDGLMVVTEPTDISSEEIKHHRFHTGRPADPNSDHKFRILFNESVLDVQVNEFSHTLKVSELGKVLGPGLIVFQSQFCRMAIRRVLVADAD